MTVQSSISNAQNSIKCDGLKLKALREFYFLKDNLSTLTGNGWKDISGKSLTNGIDDKTFGMCYEGSVASKNSTQGHSNSRVVVDGPADDYLFQVSYDLKAGNYSGKSGEVTMTYTTYLANNWKDIYAEIRRLRYVGRVGKEYSRENEEDKYGDLKIYTDGELYYLIQIETVYGNEVKRATQKITVTNREVIP